MTVVVGGQYGSEAKGKLVAHLALTTVGKVAVVRCGGTNSGHTVDIAGRRYVLRQLPSGVVEAGAALYLGAGMVIDPALLLTEMQDLAVEAGRVMVDRNAVVLEREDQVHEEKATLLDRIGSTLSGTGSATARKVLRGPAVRLAGSETRLRDLVGNVSRQLNDAVDIGGTVIVEGTQGAGLSLHHSPHYPFVTGRETSAAGFLSEVGLSPTLVDDVIAVFRTYPIRVAGNSGPLPGELTWQEVRRRSGAPCELVEYTSVTGRVRRVAEFDWDQAEEAVRLNRPTALAVHGLDYIDYADRSATTYAELSAASKAFMVQMERRLGTPVRFVFTGPSLRDLIDLRLERLSGTIRVARSLGV
ncbi:MAG: adenylosuccinate synthetase [Gemmatimonadaceae bacterium]|nr:adenylosuccinate synthetase [Actinomycetota bacterium]